MLTPHTREYEALDEDIREKLSYPDFYSLKQRNKPREWNKATRINKTLISCAR
jgi:hypothetical protein